MEFVFWWDCFCLPPLGFGMRALLVDLFRFGFAWLVSRLSFSYLHFSDGSFWSTRLIRRKGMVVTVEWNSTQCFIQSCFFLLADVVERC